ncbi:MAG: hypothetical protein EOO88_44515 [Pedobacter sp.]|nr:MAG: hypothetical protein EOO88_44515 [Pedobacter sp.]
MKSRSNQGALIGGISIGDTVCIYSKHWYQLPLAFESLNTIYQLEKGDEVYYEFEWVKSRNYGSMIISVIILIVFLIFLVLEIYTVKNINKRRRGTNI